MGGGSGDGRSFGADLHTNGAATPLAIGGNNGWSAAEQCQLKVWQLFFASSLTQAVAAATAATIFSLAGSNRRAS